MTHHKNRRGVTESDAPMTKTYIEEIEEITRDIYGLGVRGEHEKRLEYRDKILAAFNFDLLNKINDWAEENKKPVSQYHNTSEHRYLDSENHGNNQALSSLQTYLASLGK